MSHPTVRITKGGANDAEAVAVLLALDVVQRTDREAAEAAEQSRTRSGWRRAARIEGVTARRFPALTDVRGSGLRLD